MTGESEALKPCPFCGGDDVGDPADAWDAGYHAGENAARAQIAEQAAEIKRLKSIIKSNEDGEKTVQVTQACLGALLDHPCRACEEGYKDAIQARDAALVQARLALQAIAKGEVIEVPHVQAVAHSAIAAINALEEGKTDG